MAFRDDGRFLLHTDVAAQAVKQRVGHVSENQEKIDFIQFNLILKQIQHQIKINLICFYNKTPLIQRPVHTKDYNYICIVLIIILYENSKVHTTTKTTQRNYIVHFQNNFSQLRNDKSFDSKIRIHLKGLSGSIG